MSKRKVMAVTTTVSIAVDEAFGEAEALAEELDDWYNNLPDSLQMGEKGDALQQAVDELRTVSSPDDVPEAIRNTSITFTNGTKRRMSRADRRDVAVEKLRAAADYAREAIAELEQFADACEEACESWEIVEFPGMYG